MARNTRARQRRALRNPARLYRARHVLSPPLAPPPSLEHEVDLDEWGATAVELGLPARAVGEGGSARSNMRAA